MTEEQNTTTNSDDLDALRILLHTVKGLSAVSNTESVDSES
ncbi:MAG TPA: hypothetical protein VFH06_00875 [Candidatus Saccharimonadales bacterium]|nr:hypothetical protein [Candidatus Saccharimonadales bacterium]